MPRQAKAGGSGDAKVARKAIDWEAVEREYRAGQLSDREIGRLHGVSHVSVGKRAKKEGWTKNLASRVRQEVVARLAVEPPPVTVKPVTKANAKQAIEDSAARTIALVREHRQDIGSARQLVTTLVTELREATAAIGDIEDTIELEGKEKRVAMLKAVSLGARSSVIANLSVAMKNLVGLERQAFNLDSMTSPDEPSDEAAKDTGAREIIRSRLAGIASRSRPSGGSGEPDGSTG